MGLGFSQEDLSSQGKEFIVHGLTYICFCCCYAMICLFVYGHRKVKAPTLLSINAIFNDITDYKGDINGCHFSFFP